MHNQIITYYNGPRKHEIPFNERAKARNIFFHRLDFTSLQVKFSIHLFPVFVLNYSTMEMSNLGATIWNGSELSMKHENKRSEKNERKYDDEGNSNREVALFNVIISLLVHAAVYIQLYRNVDSRKKIWSQNLLNTWMISSISLHIFPIKNDSDSAPDHSWSYQIQPFTEFLFDLRAGKYSFLGFASFCFQLGTLFSIQ